MRRLAMLSIAVLSTPVWLSAQAPAAPAASVKPPTPRSTVYAVRQTVTLKDVPATASRVKAWIALPGDASAQKLMDVSVVDFPGEWRMTTEPEHGNRFLFVDAPAKAGDMTFAVDVVVRRDPVAIALNAAAVGPITDTHRKLFARELDLQAPNMVVDERIRAMADKACGEDRNVVSQARAIFHMVADSADHYSKDPSKPKCGRGNAGDCLTQQGGCCTDLHSLFVAALRSRGVPTRMVFGYRVLDKNLGKEVDPGYRCWVEFFAPKIGWVPLDVVEGDALAKDARESWLGSMSEQRLYCCEGRNFRLEPPQASGPVNTMIIGHFEIDGVAVPTLPDASGKPSPLVRTVKFSKLDVADPR